MGNFNKELEMDKTGIDMWILISREYNEDPVLKTMLPAEWLNARRRRLYAIIVMLKVTNKDSARKRRERKRIRQTRSPHPDDNNGKRK